MRRRTTALGARQSGRAAPSGALSEQQERACRTLQISFPQQQLETSVASTRRSGSCGCLSSSTATLLDQVLHAMLRGRCSLCIRSRRLRSAAPNRLTARLYCRRAPFTAPLASQLSPLRPAPLRTRHSRRGTLYRPIVHAAIEGRRQASPLDPSADLDIHSCAGLPFPSEPSQGLPRIR